MEQRTVERVLVLTPTENLTGGKETEKLTAAASKVFDRDKPRIIIDLAKIDWINSPGLGALVRIHTSCVNREGWMRVVGVGHRIKNLLVITRVIMLFDTFETVDQAVSEQDVKAIHPGLSPVGASLGQTGARP
jgi:anti-anti-sigma factor